MHAPPTMSSPCNRACSSRIFSRVVDTLKDYAVKALVNTVDHLGSVSYKVNDLLDEKFDDVSGTELRVSCIEQRLRTCQGFIDHEGFSQQSLVMTTPKYHKRYILPDGKSMPGSGRQAVPHHQKVNQPKGERESQQHQAALCATIKDNSPSFRKMFSRSPSLRARSNSPSPKIRSPSPSPQLGKSVFSDKGAGLPIPTSKPNPLLRSGSLSSKPTVLNPSKNVRRHPTKPEKSASMRLHAERDQHDAEQSPSKSKRLLKALLSRRKSRKDEMLDTYLDEY
uniref:Protein ABIL3 n=1 Tax=Anthurium amnicola TaxID=1678845 RepID=A0A1D1XJI0_9ARAE